MARAWAGGVGQVMPITVCDRPFAGSLILGEARLGTGRIHSLVNRWIPWCHSEPAAAPATLLKLEQKPGQRRGSEWLDRAAPHHSAHQLYNNNPLLLNTKRPELNNSTTILYVENLDYVINSLIRKSRQQFADLIIIQEVLL